MPLQATSGAASYDAFGGGVAAVPNYIEDVFSTYLYTGNGSTQTITNGIDLSTKGGLTWLKRRDAVGSQVLYDTARGATKVLSSNNTDAEATATGGLTAFNVDGFSLGANYPNTNTATFASWTFRKQPKFFDVVTYTGDGNLGRTVAHNLGSVPGCIIIKNTGTGGTNWGVYHRSVGATGALFLNQTYDVDTSSSYWNNTAPTSTVFTVGNQDWNNQSGESYVAYLYAHDAGGFGLTGTDNVISCGSFTTDGSGYIPTVNLGYEPQWILAKPSSGTGNWFIMDNMRGWYNQQADQGNALFPNTSGAEAVGYNAMIPTATGFTGPAVNFGAGITYIYIAIRRGPMKVPTSGTSVYETITSSATAGTVLTTGFPVDLQMQAFRSTTGAHRFMDRLRGVSTNSTAGSISLASTSDAAETSTGSYSLAWNNTGFQMTTAFESTSGVFWNFRRAPSFFDEVCDSLSGTVNHNLGVAPELIIAKVRNYSPQDWFVDVPALGSTRTLNLNTTGAASSTNYISSPTATQFTTTLGGGGYNYVYYLFATCAGVSKVGSYTGTATTLQVDCGFTGGARFVLIKKTSGTGSWYVWDSARGIVSGNDPYLLLNSTAAEVTSTDYIDTYSAGFEISSTAPSEINENGGSFIFLAIS